MPKEVSVDQRVAAAKKLYKAGKYTLVGPLQAALKKQFGKGIPPKRLSEVFGTSGKRKKAKTGQAKRGPGRPRKDAQPDGAPARQTRRGAQGFPIETSASNGLDYWADLVAYLNQNTTGRTSFSIRLDGQTAALVAE